jgi:hypothetical protein
MNLLRPFFLGVLLFGSLAAAQETPPPAGELVTPPVLTARSVQRGDLSGFVTLFGGTPRAVNLLGSAGSAATSSANLELGIALSDLITLKVLTGLTALSSGGTVLWGFNAGGGADFYLRDSSSMVRPVIGFDVRFGKYVSMVPDEVALNLGARFGAAVFPYRFLALRISAGVDLPMQFKNTVFGIQLVPFELGAGIFF